MDAGVVFAVIAAVVVLAGAVGFWVHLRGRAHPEDTASHDTRYTPDRREDEQMAPYPGTDRPAGPGAEGMAPAAPGDVVPGAPGEVVPGAPPTDQRP